MKIVTPHRVATLVAAVAVALTLTMSLVVIEHGDAQAQGVDPFDSGPGPKNCSRTSRWCSVTSRW